MRIADTSALYAVFDESDAHHADAWRAIQDPDPIVVSAEILVETEGLIRLRMGRHVAAGAVDDLLSLPQVRLEGGRHLQAALAAYRKHRELSLADAVVVAQSILHDAEPFTFDAGIQDALP